MDNSGKWQKFITLFFLAFFKNVKAQIKFLHQKKNLSFNTSLEISRLGFSKFQTSSSKWEAELMFDKLFFV